MAIKWITVSTPPKFDECEEILIEHELYGFRVAEKDQYGYSFLVAEYYEHYDYQIWSKERGWLDTEIIRYAYINLPGEETSD